MLKLKLPTVTIGRSIYWGVSILFLGGAIVLGWFLYQYVYVTLTDATNISEQRAGQNATTVREGTLQKVLDRLDARQQPLAPGRWQTKNPFAAPTPTVVPPAAPVSGNQPPVLF